MSKLSVMEQLHAEWSSLNQVWLDGQSEVNQIMLQFCLGKGRAPTRRKLDQLARKFKEMTQSRLELDNFMREYASSPKCLDAPVTSEQESKLFIQAAHTAQS